MDDSSGVTIVDTTDELEQEEFDLIGGDSCFMFRHVFFHIVVKEVKDEMKFFLTGQVDDFSESME